MASRDSEIRQVVSQLDVILAALRDNVDELTGILTGPSVNGDGTNERTAGP